MTRTTTVQTRRIDTCPECDGPVRQVGQTETACADCGLVVSDRPIDRGPEPGFSSDPDEADERTGAPLTATVANRGLSTWMGSCRRDGHGNRIDSAKQARLRRQRTRQRRAAADANKDTLAPGLREIDRLCSELETGDSVAETASVAYRRALEESVIYGWAYESIAAATVYIAARNTGAVRTMAEVVGVSCRSKRRIARAVRHVQRELDIAVDPPEVTEYLPTISDDLTLSQRAVRLARRLLDAATAENIHSGRDPSALAASALYTVTLVEPETPDLCQTEVSEAADVSPLTVRSHFRELRPLCPAVFDVEPEAIQSPKARAGKRASHLDDTDGPASPDREVETSTTAGDQSLQAD